MSYLTIIGFLCLFVLMGNSSADDSCQALVDELDLKKRQMREYSGLLDTLDQKKDAPLINLLNHKIRELKDQIRKMDDELTECSSVANLQKNPKKTLDDATLKKKSCGELRNLLLQLLRKTYQLKRRENSIFSELSSSEKEELDSFQNEIARVKELLKLKCAEPKPAPPFRLQPR